MASTMAAAIPDRSILFRPHAAQKRIDWFFESYRGNNVSDKSEFVRRVNEAYYRHAASLYHERFVADIEQQYQRMCHTLKLRERDDLNIVDIGGGTGFEYQQLLRNNVDWQSFHFIEPHQEMIDEFIAETHQSDRPVTVVKGTFDDFYDQACTLKTKLLVMNSCLHHVIEVESLTNKLRNCMHVGDLCMFCHEPNTRYTWSPLMYLSNLLQLMSPIVLARRLGWQLTSATRANSAVWKSVNNDLIASGIISKPMKPLAIRRTIDYWVGVKGDWRSLGIPAEYNEGFWTPEDILKLFGPDFNLVYLQTYRHLGGNISRTIERQLERIAPTSGSVFCMAIERTH